MSEDLKNQIKTILYKLILEQIRADLTTGQEDQDLDPYTIEQINNFVIDNEANIQKVISDMINAYEDDEELEDLLEPEPDWIREFLYEHVKVPNMINDNESEDE